jgi:hypothetical protein
MFAGYSITADHMFLAEIHGRKRGREASVEPGLVSQFLVSMHHESTIA